MSITFGAFGAKASCFFACIVSLKLFLLLPLTLQIKFGSYTISAELGKACKASPKDKSAKGSDRFFVDFLTERYPIGLFSVGIDSAIYPDPKWSEALSTPTISKGNRDENREDNGEETQMIRNPNPRPNTGRPHKYSPLPATDEEIVRFFEEQRKRLPVFKTTRTPSGQVLDWIPVEAQHPHGKIATPPPAREGQGRAVEPSRRAATFEMNDTRIERGPDGTVPVLRRDFSRLHVTGKLSDYPRKRKVDGRWLTPRADKPSVADPDPFGYYHATSAQWAIGYGCEAVLNMWDPYTEFSSDHSISQVACRTTTMGQPIRSRQGGRYAMTSTVIGSRTCLLTTRPTAMRKTATTRAATTGTTPAGCSTMLTSSLAS
jgi:hypothetical protein